ncbi:hypothetical protein WJX81_000399 [Elliptochloris bilobata]|uniref:RRM domain-containing protein n=1 Tax=Elliptochloris bilobata TaxID=381761 RepID=A0AAW1SJM6_9CHLO
MAAAAEQEGCKALYVGNLHPYVNEVCLQDLFGTVGAVTDVKLVKDKASGQSAGSAFVKYDDHRAAAIALQTINGHCIYGKELRVSWAFQKDKAEDTATHFHIFVGNLSGNVTDPTLLNAFKAVRSCSDARVMWDHATGRSKGYGFVSFRTQEDAERAIQTMNGMVVGQWRVRCGWANHKQETVGEMNAAAVDKADPTNSNVYVGNLSAEVDDGELTRQFSRFGAVSGVKACLKGGYGFVQFCEHTAAVAAIVEMNGRQLGGKTLKCAWGRHHNRAAQPAAPAAPAPVLPPPPINAVAVQGLLRLGMLGGGSPSGAAPRAAGMAGGTLGLPATRGHYMQAGAPGVQLGAGGSEGNPAAYLPGAYPAALYGGQQAAAYCTAYANGVGGGYHLGMAHGAPDPGLGLAGGSVAGGAYHGQPLPAAVPPALFAEQQFLLAASYGAQQLGHAGEGGGKPMGTRMVPSAQAVSEAEFSEHYYSQYYNQP